MYMCVCMTVSPNVYLYLFVCVYVCVCVCVCVRRKGSFLLWCLSPCSRDTCLTQAMTLLYEKKRQNFKCVWQKDHIAGKHSDSALHMDFDSLRNKCFSLGLGRWLSC